MRTVVAENLDGVRAVEANIVHNASFAAQMGTAQSTL
jgi:hypothetical protein